MQGKERNNGRMDADFQNYAWSEMSALLDKELPVAPSPAVKVVPYRRYALFAALLMLGFFSGVGTMLILDKKVPSAPEVKPTEIKTPQKIAGLEDNLNSPSSAETAELIVQQKRNQRVETQIRNTILSKSTTNSNTGNLYTNSSSVISESQKAEVTRSGKAIATAAETTARISPESQTVRSGTETLSPALEKPWIHSVNQLSAKPVNSLARVRPAIDLAYIPGKKVPKWSFGVLLSNHTRDWSGAHGWSAGLTTNIRMDGAFSLRTGIAYSQLTGFRSTSFGINEPLTHTYFEPLDGNTGLGNSSVSSLEGNQDLPFQSLHYVDIPVALNYQMSRRVGVLMGIKMSYLLDTQMDSYVSEGLDDNGKELLDQALYGSMRKVDVATVLGLSIYPTQNIGLEIKYNHGLIDYTKDQLWHIRQLNTNKTFELGLHYTIR